MLPVLPRSRNINELVSKVFAKYIADNPGDFVLGGLTCSELGKRILIDFLRQNNADRTSIGSSG